MNDNAPINGNGQAPEAKVIYSPEINGGDYALIRTPQGILIATVHKKGTIIPPGSLCVATLNKENSPEIAQRLCHRANNYEDLLRGCCYALKFFEVDRNEFSKITGMTKDDLVRFLTAAIALA